MAKEYVDFTQNEYFNAKVSLDGEDIKLKPKNNRTLDFTGTILINGQEPGSGGEQVQSDWAQTDDTKVDFIKNKPTIPDAVSVTQVQSTGTKIATITVGSTGTDIYAPEGGTSGTDIVTPTVGATITLDSEKYYNLGTISSDLTISFNAAASGKVGIYAGEFVYSSASPAQTVTFPNGILWKETVTYTDGKLYQFSVVNNKGVIAEFTTLP